jgi:dipeptidyl aminopeptidase/acylaminoacyl peptidase
MRIHKTVLAVLTIASCALTAAAQTKPKLTLDEFFNSVDFTALEMSPDGSAVVVATGHADWDQQIFRKDLWLWRGENKINDAKNDASRPGSLIQLTQSGHDSEPKWSPDGRWIAFLSERKSPTEKSGDSDSDSGSDSKDKDDETSQLYLISPSGGEAFPVTQGDEDVHAFSWSGNSQTLYFATRQPWSKAQKDNYKKDWKDVVQYRTAERGDTIFSLDLPVALARHAAATPENPAEKEDDDATPGAAALATLPLRVDQLFISPNGSQLGILTNSINQRQEKDDDVEIYTLSLFVSRRATDSAGNPDPDRPFPIRVTHNHAVETNPRWASDNRHIFFTVETGDVSGPYRDLQPHLYWVDAVPLVPSAKPSEHDSTEHDLTEQWSKDFIGPIDHYVVSFGNILASARIGTEVQLYSAAKPADSLHRLSAWPGTYSQISTAAHSPKIAFLYSSLSKPEEVYLADSFDKLNEARPITSFNQLFTERELPQGKPYQWKADDGTTIEGMLIYPPEKFEQKHLPMLTLIHGGPADADGNSFAADWYDWAGLAATNGWLVFRPNYRGSTGYGDKFLQQIVPQIVSRPGKDILEGIDALVKDGIADPDHLTIGGYSYGGYMTNWLITQTTRFKAAVTGAGAVEHIGNWGNDDTNADDAYFLGGRPWEAAQRYHDEAAIFQIDKVRTPTHMVAGADDIRVAVLEDYLLEHALYSLGIPNKLLIFPGEGHGLGKNPWHGKIKVREELNWLQKYGGAPAAK